MQQKSQIGKVSRWRRSRAHQPANLIHPPHHALVKHIVVAHGVIDALRALDQAGEDFVEVVYRKSIINAEVSHRTLRAKTVAVPQLHLRVALPAK